MSLRCTKTKLKNKLKLNRKIKKITKGPDKITNEFHHYERHKIKSKY